jgi:hypothetical protein
LYIKNGIGGKPGSERPDFEERAARESNHTVDYLEIGSCQGVSMGVIGSVLRSPGALGKLTSIDPYFDKRSRDLASRRMSRVDPPRS